MRSDEPMILARPTKAPVQHRDAAALQFGYDQNGRTGVWITCGACGAKDGHTFPPQAPPLAIDQRFAQERGWLVERHGQRATCPKCQEKKPAVTEPPINRIKADRILHDLLREHLDIAGDVGEYEAGWSDARIAEESGLAEKYVGEVRREAYAPKLKDRMSETILAELAAIEATAKKEYDELKAMLDTARDQTRSAIQELRNRLRGGKT